MNISKTLKRRQCPLEGTTNFHLFLPRPAAFSLEAKICALSQIIPLMRCSKAGNQPASKYSLASVNVSGSSQTDYAQILEGGEVVDRTGAIGKIRSVYCRDPDDNLIEYAISNLSLRIFIGRLTMLQSFELRLSHQRRFALQDIYLRLHFDSRPVPSCNFL